MSPQKQIFGQAVKGNTPDRATATGVLMGKDTDVKQLAANIQNAINNGVGSPVNWMNASTIVEPGGGLEAKGNENSTYNYNGDGNFGFPDRQTLDAAKPN